MGIAHKLFIWGNYTAVMRYFERAVSLVPELGKKAMPPMTMPAMTIDKWTEAWKRFDRAYALWREGDAMLQQRRYTEAISVLLQAVNLAPRWAALHSTLVGCIP